MNQSMQTVNTVIFGLGLSGLSAARYFDRTGHDFVIADSRDDPPNQDEIRAMVHCKASYFGDVPQSLLNSAGQIILSPGVDPRQKSIAQARQAGAKLLGDVELFIQTSQKPIVAITGSNGKSTVTDLTCRLLNAAGVKAKIAGNFGLPVLDYLPEDDAEIYVLELSSFQLDTTPSMRAKVAVLLNITEDHMDRYPDFAAYQASKLQVFLNAEQGLINDQDPACLEVRSQALTLCSSVQGFASDWSPSDKSSPDFYLQKQAGQYWLNCQGKAVLAADELSIKGLHNASNALVALAILQQLGVAINQAVLAALCSYQGLAHRFQLVKSWSIAQGRVDWVNDSKATNPGATQAALDSIDRNEYEGVVLLAGGDSKGADVSVLTDVLSRKISHLVVIGRDGQKLAALLKPEQVSFARDMGEAVTIMADKAKILLEGVTEPPVSEPTGKKVLALLSPACASLDMFKNYEARGQAFADAVVAVCHD